MSADRFFQTDFPVLLIYKWLLDILWLTNLPFGENLTKETGGLSSSIRVFKHCPLAVSQIRLKVRVLILCKKTMAIFLSLFPKRLFQVNLLYLLHDNLGR